MRENRKMLLLVAGSIALAGILMWNQLRMVPYVPVRLVPGGDGEIQYMVYDTSILTPEHIDRVRGALKNHGEHFLDLDNTIYIRNYLSKDMELLCTYTALASH